MPVTEEENEGLRDTSVLLVGVPLVDFVLPPNERVAMFVFVAAILTLADAVSEF